MGRPSKGTRQRLNLRVALNLYVELARLATQAGTDLNTYCEAVLTAHTRSVR
jgi:predicted HicB family RNase H-like nuclease